MLEGNTTSHDGRGMGRDEEKKHSADEDTPCRGCASGGGEL